MLADQYRPAQWCDFAGNEKAVTVAQRLVNNALKTNAGLAVWIDGASGIGKTSLALVMAKALGVSDWDTVQMNAQGFDAHRAKELGRELAIKPLSGGFRAVIVDEAHAMTPGAVQVLLSVLEPMPRRVLIAFTTTEGRKCTADLFGQFSDPLLSRCVKISLTSQGLAPAFTKRAMQIAESIGLGGIAEKQAIRIVQDAKNNMREILSRVQSGDFMAA